MEDHSSRRTKYKWKVPMICQEVDQKGIASLKNISKGQGFLF